MISNCCAAGHDSFVQPITGVVQRRDPVSGVAAVAAVRGNGVPEQGALKADTVVGAGASFGEALVPASRLRAYESSKS